VEGVVWFKKGPQTATRILGLGPAFGGEFDAVVGDGLVDVAVFWDGQVRSKIL